MDERAPSVAVHPELNGRLRLGWATARLGAPADPAALDAAIARETAALAARFAGRTAGEIPHLRPARELYRAIGLDPTKTRPSPEALTRRILRGDPFPRVHPAVDLANLWAVLHGLPVGLYDRDKLEGPIEARVGRAGESYEGIRKGEIHLEGRFALFDARGPFGNPSSDSLRASVDEGSRALLFVLWAPGGHPESEMARWLEWLARASRDLLGAEDAATSA
ncbi:MAG TPA: phenylalanine--tRNA ligase beta subunit-related protein [Acidobacteriota bacterium]|nr:phenylalanine--tRNA ligase beta subunit-related protein [Acidobacteriota bacterium]